MDAIALNFVLVWRSRARERALAQNDFTDQRRAQEDHPPGTHAVDPTERTISPDRATTNRDGDTRDDISTGRRFRTRTDERGSNF